MAVTVTPEEKAELASAGSLIRPLDGAGGVASSVYHDPKTGQEFFGLPIDAYHLTRYLRRGRLLGRASPELRAKWEAGEEDRTAADDALMAEKLAGSPSPIAETPRFQEAVEAAVTQVLEKLGVEIPREPQASQEEAASAVETNDPVQLDFFKTVDAPTETDTKLTVSEASRPNLYLVDASKVD